MTERTRARLGTELESGDVVYIRYKDHLLFKDVDPRGYAKPFVRETLGWLDHEDNESVRVIWERFFEPMSNKEAKQRASGLVIMKSSILKLGRVG